VLVEHARNLIGIADATHAEYGVAGTPIVTLLACSLDGTTIDVDLTPQSRLSRMYGTTRATEATTCNYGLEPALNRIADEAGMIVAAVDQSGEVRAVERPDHPFFVATLYQPQLTSSPAAPHPIWRAFVDAVTC
jgi:CTP synthase (UTP-ammonia lyase)